MKRLLFVLGFLATTAFAAEPHPGYGVVKLVDRVLVTNAGDVVRDFQYAQSSGGERGTVAPGTSPGGSRPQDGAIQGGSILPGERNGVPNETPGKAAERCEELQGRLRDQCLLREEQQRSSTGGSRNPAPTAPPPNAPPPQNPR